MRYMGQGHEISVKMPKGKLTSKNVSLIKQSFIDAYIQKYGRVIDAIPMETVTWRLIVSNTIKAIKPKQQILSKQGNALKGHRNVYWGNAYESTAVYDRYSMPENKLFNGPCIIEEFESTTVVGKNSTVQVDEYKNILINLKYQN